MVEISIIVPVYKVENYIERCVTSILNQTFKSFELILVDDGSPDKSGKICDLLAKTDSRIKVIHKKNGGVSSARNAGLEIAHGKYVMFCDSDDYVESDWCKSLYDLIIQENVSIVFGGYKIVDKNHVIGIQTYSEEEKVIVSQKEFWNIYMHNLLNMPWNKIYFMDVIKQNQINFDENLQYGEDMLFVMEYLKYTDKKLGISNSCLYCYERGMEVSLSRRYIQNLWDIRKRIFKEIDYFLELYNIDFESIETEYYDKWIWTISYSLNNNEKHMNDSLITVWKKNREILSSNECKKAFKNGSFRGYNPIYAFFLKRRSVLLLALFKFLLSIYDFIKCGRNTLTII